MLKSFYSPILLAIGLFLWFPTHCDLFFAEEYINELDDTRYLIFHDYHISSAQSAKQRYDFIKGAYQLDASCSLEDPLVYFFPMGSFSRFFQKDHTSLAGLNLFCRDLSIPSQNVDFRAMRLIFFNLPFYLATNFADVTGKQIMHQTKVALAEIKSYDDGSQANKRYKVEIDTYEKIIQEHKAFFDHLDQDVPFQSLVQTMDTSICSALAAKLDKIYYNAVNEDVNPEQTKINVLQLFDFPLIELKLFHHALTQKKKYRFIATGAMHAQRLSKFFITHGFKKGRTFGTFAAIEDAHKAQPLDLEQLFIQLAAAHRLRPEPFNLSLKILGVVSRVEQSPYRALISPFISGTTMLVYGGICVIFSNSISRCLFENSSLKTRLAGAALLYGISGVFLVVRAKQDTYREHMVPLKL